MARLASLLPRAIVWAIGASAAAEARPTVRFDVDKPLPRRLVKKLIDVRLRQAFAS